ncbi:MAG: permease [Bacillota bacterium]|nr:permease [Bacillota bacterium]
MQLNNLLTAGRYFLVITGELILLFVGITFLVGLIQQLVPEEKTREVLGKPRRGLGNIIGAAFGALTPFCSCSTIPILVGLLNSGAPFGASISFLLTSPVLNPVILGLFLTLFGWRVTFTYGIITFILAAAGGALWERLGLASEVKKVDLASNPAGSCCAGACCAQMETIPLDLFTQNTGLWEKIKPKIKGAAAQARTLFFQVLPYLLLGAGIGAFIYGFVPAAWIAKIAGPQNPFAVPVAAIVGIPMYIRAETIIPIGLTLMQKGMALGTVAALIIGGAGASIPELTLLAAIFRPRLVAAFMITILFIAVAAGFTFNLFF